MGKPYAADEICAVGTRANGFKHSIINNLFTVFSYQFLLL